VSPSPPRPPARRAGGWWVYIVPTLVLLTLQITGRWPSPARAVEAAPTTPAVVSADESDAEEPADAVVTS